MKAALQAIYEPLHIVYSAAISHWPLLLVCGAAFVAFAILVLRAVARRFTDRSEEHSHQNDERRAKTSRTEIEVPEALLRLPRDEYHVFSDIYIQRHTGDGTTHLHHVVFSRSGIFVIHVESGDGRIEGKADDKRWFRRNEHGQRPMSNPLWRNLYHVKALANFLGMPERFFHSVILFDGEVSFASKTPANVLTTGLGRFIMNKDEELLTRDTLERVTRVMEAVLSTMDREAARQEHHASRRRVHPASAPLLISHA